MSYSLLLKSLIMYRIAWLHYWASLLMSMSIISSPAIFTTSNLATGQIHQIVPELLTNGLTFFFFFFFLHQRSTSYLESIIILILSVSICNSINECIRARATIKAHRPQKCVAYIIMDVGLCHT